LRLTISPAPPSNSTLFSGDILGPQIIDILIWNGIDIKGFIGGSVWESNPPCPFVTGNTGFEVRERHQSPIHSPVIHYRIPYKRMNVK